MADLNLFGPWIFVCLIVLTENVVIDPPCYTDWVYDINAGKCYKLLSGLKTQENGLDACKADFPFTGYRNRISLIKFKSANDRRAIYKLLASKSNNAKVWMDAKAADAPTKKYKWSNDDIIDNENLKTTVNKMTLGGDCLSYYYIYEMEGNQFETNHYISSENCISNLTVICQHDAVKCEESGVIGYDPTKMVLTIEMRTVQVTSHIACQEGFFRASDLIGIPQPDPSDTSKLPANYARCQGTPSNDKNPFKYSTSWFIDPSHRRISDCTAIACSKYNGTIQNAVAITTLPSATSYKYGVKIDVKCNKGYVNYKDVNNVFSNIKCSQSFINKMLGVWEPEDNKPCRPIICNLTQLDSFQPQGGRISGAKNKFTQEVINLKFQRYKISYYDTVVEIRCDDGTFFPDRNYYKKIICSLKDGTETIGQWKGYLGTTLPLFKACEPVTCKYEDIVAKESMHLKPYWMEMNSSGIYENKTVQLGNPYPYNSKLRFFCVTDYDTAESKQDQNVTCGPQGKWIPNLTACIHKTKKLDTGTKKRYIPPAVEAPAAQEVGYGTIIILVIFFVIIIVLDLSTLSRDLKLFQRNIKNLKLRCKKKQV